MGNSHFHILYIILRIITKPEFAASLVEQLNKSPEFQLAYQRDDVYLFVKNKKS